MFAEFSDEGHVSFLLRLADVSFILVVHGTSTSMTRRPREILELGSPPGTSTQFIHNRITFSKQLNIDLNTGHITPRPIESVLVDPDLRHVGRKIDQHCFDRSDLQTCADNDEEVRFAAVLL